MLIKSPAEEAEKKNQLASLLRPKAILNLLYYLEVIDSEFLSLAKPIKDISDEEEAELYRLNL